jgi:tagatose 1,6-diphosphate aldolase
MVAQFDKILFVRDNKGRNFIPIPKKAGFLMKNLSIGKYRGLQQCATDRGAISVLALDHRNNLRNSLNPTDPKSVTDAQMMDFKCDVISSVGAACSAVLLDPEYGIANGISCGALPGHTGLIATLDATGYTGDSFARHSNLLGGWGVKKARRMGANAVKLLVYYHPDAPTSKEIESLVARVGEECLQEDIPFFLETLSYSLSPSSNKLTPSERHRVVIETARRLTPLGADVLKPEFPMDISAEVDEAAWAKACAELSVASVVPWVLLSASVSFEIFLRQTTIACGKGASGVAVGRAVWQEAATMTGELRRNFLHDKVVERMSRVTAVCNALARPWTDFYRMDKPSMDWYRKYSE